MILLVSLKDNVATHYTMVDAYLQRIALYRLLKAQKYRAPCENLDSLVIGLIA